MFEPKIDSYLCRKDFEYCLNILKENIDNQRISFAKSQRLFNGLTSVHYAPNGRLDLLSVDESVRSMMHMMPHMNNMINSVNHDTEK